MSEPMTPEELQACRERAEAATARATADDDDLSDMYEEALAQLGDPSSSDAILAAYDYPARVDSRPLLDAIDELRHARTDVPRLLATIAARDEEIARLTAKVEAALAGRHEWTRHEQREGWTVCVRCGMVRNYDKRGWSCRGARAKADTSASPESDTNQFTRGLGTALTVERKPVAGWRESTGGKFLRAGPIATSVRQEGDLCHLFTSLTKSNDDHGTTLEAAQLAAEDALFAIADAINALRGGR